MATKKWHSYRSLSLMFIFLQFASCDMMQYKRIGDTEYYLVEVLGNESYRDIHYKRYPGGFGEGVAFRGFAKDVYWNDEYMIVKCIDTSSEDIMNYCIIELFGRSNSYAPWVVHEYATEKEFEEAKRDFGLEEEKMNYTDSHLPWRLF